jgi:hypothetical protein
MSGADRAREVRRAYTLIGPTDDEEETRRVIARTVGVTIEFVHGVLGPLPEPATPARRIDEMPTLHESCEYIPAAGPEKVKELVDEIRVNGLKDPIVLDHSGLLIDGRGRWEACTLLGVRPRMRAIRSNAWEFSITANRPRLTDFTERLILAAKMPVRLGGPRVDVDHRPPTSEFICDAWEIPWGSWKPLRAIVRAGFTHDVLLDAVRDGTLKPGTARRIAMNTPEDQWPELVAGMRLVEKGGPPVVLPEYRFEREKRGSRPIIYGGSGRGQQSVVTADHLRKAMTALQAFATVVESADGLDPLIDSDLAATLYRDLATARRPLNQVVTQLERPSPTSRSPRRTSWWTSGSSGPWTPTGPSGSLTSSTRTRWAPCRSAGAPTG